MLIQLFIETRKWTHRRSYSLFQTFITHARLCSGYLHYEETIAIVGRHKAYIFYHDSEQSFDVVIIPIFIDFTLPQLLHVREMQFYVKLYPTLTLSPRT